MSRFLKNKIAILPEIEVRRLEHAIEVYSRLSGASIFVNVYPYADVDIIDNLFISVSAIGDGNNAKAGTIYKKIQNAVQDIKSPFKVSLKLIGVGFKAIKDGHFLFLSIGYSHEECFKLPKGVDATIAADGVLLLYGFDRELVSNFAQYVKNVKKVEPYKGKGIRYSDQVVKIKVGKKN
jgi:large subunit ribosomal protein L6